MLITLIQKSLKNNYIYAIVYTGNEENKAPGILMIVSVSEKLYAYINTSNFLNLTGFSPIGE